MMKPMSYIRWFTRLSAPFLLVSGLGGQEQAVQLSIEEASITLSEQESTIITLILDKGSFLDFEVGFTIEPIGSATEAEDFFLGTDEEDPVTSPITFPAGQREFIIPVTIVNDALVDPGEGFIFRIDPAETTVVEVPDPDNPPSVTINIEDNDLIQVGFERSSATFTEGEDSNISVRIETTSVAGSAILVPYTVNLGTATESDLNIPDTTEFSITAGRVNSDLFLTIENDLIPEDTKTLSLTLGTPILQDEGETPLLLLDGAETIQITLEDDDPFSISIAGDQDDPENFNRTISENNLGTNLQTIRLEVTSEPGVEVSIPYTITNATATNFTDDEDNADFALSVESPLIINQNSSNTQITVQVNNDQIVEDDEVFTIEFGTPFYEDDDGNTVNLDPLDGINAIDFTIEDNDPVLMNFGQRFSQDDRSDIEDDDRVDLIAIGSAIVEERDRFVIIPVFLSDRINGVATFTLELDVDATTATIFDPDIPQDEQEWDFRFTGNVDINGTSRTSDQLTISPFAQTSRFNIVLEFNDDEESIQELGGPRPEDAEEDEVVVLRISEVNTDSSGVQLGEFPEFTLTIRDMPDIDITSQFSNFNLTAIDSAPNFTTGLYSANMQADYTGNINLADFPGYRSLKLLFNNVRYDVENPDAPDNDTLLTEPETVATDEPFDFIVREPQRLRYYSGVDRFTLSEGIPFDDTVESTDIFTTENADILFDARFLLTPLSIPPLNPEFEDLRDTEQPAIGYPFQTLDDFDYTLEFTHGGQSGLNTERLNPEVEDGIRLLLSRSGDQIPLQPANTGTNIPILDVIEQTDGSIMLVIDSSAPNAQRIQIEYWDGVGEWKVAQPDDVNTSGSRFWWIDNGPPKTDPHPSEVNMRLYRVRPQ